MNWKKEVKHWGLLLGVFAVLYFTGLMTPIVGQLQSLVLATGLIKPNTENSAVDKSIDYQARFTDVNNNTIYLENFQGRALFINLWATWCPPCRAEMPHISDLYDELKDVDNLEFFMIALDDDFEKSKKFVNNKGFSFPIVHAAYGLNRSFHSQSIPTTIVVDRSGKIIFFHEGMSNFNTKEFKEFLVNAANG